MWRGCGGRHFEQSLDMSCTVWRFLLVVTGVAHGERASHLPFPNLSDVEG